MTAQIIDGKGIAETIQQSLAKKIQNYLQKDNRPPGLAVILVGQDPASLVYIRNKHLACAKIGIRSHSFTLDSFITQESLLNLVDELNEDSNIDGILVQLPLPKHISTELIIERISPNKDVDGFHPYNIGRLAIKNPALRPCTPLGIMTILNTLKIPLAGLNATVVGVSNIVGRPMVLELLMAGCTVTACHRLTRNLNSFVENADLLVVAAGSPHLIKGNWIKQNSIVIDVGMNRLEDGSFVGDVDFNEAKKRAKYITPVPGGVGPMTVTTLLQNTILAYESSYLQKTDQGN